MGSDIYKAGHLSTACSLLREVAVAERTRATRTLRLAVAPLSKYLPV